MMTTENRSNLFSSCQPTLSTSRLLLRPFVIEDIEMVVKLAGHRDIAATTIRIPHPYTTEDARVWISAHEEVWRQGESVVLAIVARSGDCQHVIGAVELELNLKYDTAKLGYWIGVPFQKQGFATEAVAEIINFAFRELHANCVSGEYFLDNYGSERVMENCGMIHEGVLRERYKKWGEYKDLGSCSILRRDWEAAKQKKC